MRSLNPHDTSIRGNSARSNPENVGPHAGPMDALRKLDINDVPMGELWPPSPRHRVHDYQRFFVKQTTSAAHTCGRLDAGVAKASQQP